MRPSLHAHVRHGRLVLDEPTDLPEGQVVELVLAEEVRAGDEDAGDDAERRTWWRAHRPAVASLFEQELEAATERLGVEPKAGTLNHQEGFALPVRRLLLEKTKRHLYDVVEVEEIVLLTVWGTPKGRAPKL